MTTREWRNKRLHRRCAFCVYYIAGWCSAKMKNVNDDIPKWFCALYKQEEGLKMPDLISREALLELYADEDGIDMSAYNIPVSVIRQNILDMPTITPESLARQEPQSSGCKFCTTAHEDWSDGGAHDFRLNGNSLFYFDYVFGWEGIRVNFCPMCGRRLGEEDRP